MTCDTRLKPRQTIQERAAEVRAAAERFARGLTTGKVRVVVDKKSGAVAFSGLTEEERDGITDACAYRRLMATGSAAAKAAIAKAEALAGRAVSREALAAGIHTHDGVHWHHGH